MLNIQFKVKAQTGHNQQIRIVGSLQQLGSWNPSQGLRLQRTSIGQWQSQDPIEIEQNKKFEFKVVKIKDHGQIEWQKLPNNSNRKFKPKYHSKLIIVWSSAEGKVVNQSKRSYKVKGLPAAIIKNKKNQKKSSLFDPHKKAAQSDSQKQDEDAFGFLQKKPVVDPRMKINIQDIQEMYYDTTQVQMTYGQIKKPKVYIICKNLNLVQNQFHLKIAEQAQQMEQLLINWFYYQKKGDVPKTKKLQFQQLPQTVLKGDKLLNQQFSILNDQYGFFIFLDLFFAKNVDVKDLKACLFLKGQQFEQVEQNIECFKQFKLIAFDHPQKNHDFFQFLAQRKSSSQIQQSDCQPLTPTINQNKQCAKVSLQSILQQLHTQQFAKAVKVNTVYSISQKESLEKILQYNSVLIIDCALKEANNQFFQKLISQDVKKRMIIIVAPDHCPQSIKQFIPRKDIVIISGNYSKIRMKEKVHQPMRKHLQIIQLLKMKAQLSKQIYGGQISYDQRNIIYKNNEKPQLLKKIQFQMKTILKDMTYFKITHKKNRIKITWFLAPKIRLIRTLCRVKFLSEGKIGNFQLISVQQNFQDLKNQIKMLVQLRTFFLQNSSNTKVEHFSYGNKVQAKYTIIPSESKYFHNIDPNTKIEDKK